MAAREPQSATAPLVVIVGPTASGKTGLAIELAKEFDGEIICADSRTIYKGMDIGTAKPTLAERATVPHWGLDLVEPGERFTAYDFKQYTDAKIEEIRRRGHVPFLVGGTGLYIDAVVLGYEFSNSFDGILRGALESKTLNELQIYCKHNNIILPENNKNKRYIINTILRESISTKSKTEPDENTIVVGITTNKAVLLDRMKARAEQMFNDGVVDETILLGKKYGWDAEILKSNGYRVVKESQYMSTSREEMISKTATLDWQLAKRQLTWLRRNAFIKWLNLDEARAYIAKQLAK